MRNAVLIWFRQVGIKAQNFISLYCLHRSSNYCNNNNNKKTRRLQEIKPFVSHHLRRMNRKVLIINMLMQKWS